MAFEVAASILGVRGAELALEALEALRATENATVRRSLPKPGKTAGGPRSCLRCQRPGYFSLFADSLVVKPGLKARAESREPAAGLQLAPLLIFVEAYTHTHTDCGVARVQCACAPTRLQRHGSGQSHESLRAHAVLTARREAAAWPREAGSHRVVRARACH